VGRRWEVGVTLGSPDGRRWRRARSNTADVFEDTRELLNWQTDFLLRQETDAEFLVQVPAYLQTLRGEPRLAIHMEDLDREAALLLAAHEPHDSQELPELSQIRDELVQRAPEAGDSEEAPPSGGLDMLRWAMTLAAFDPIVSGELQPASTSGFGLGRTGHLVEMLQAKLQRLQRPLPSDDGAPSSSRQNQRPDLDDLAMRLGNVARRHEHFANHVRLTERTSAGLALKRLDGVLSALNPPPLQASSPEELSSQFRSSVVPHVSTGGHALFLSAHGEQLDDAHTQFVADRVRDLRKDVQRLHADLRRRIGTTASRLALVLRFKHRAEWYDRDRLRELAELKQEPLRIDSRASLCGFCSIRDYLRLPSQC
jgi:hypothetical protein